MAENSGNGNGKSLPLNNALIGHVVFWAVVALIGWIFTTVMEHDRELSKRGPRIDSLEKRVDRLRDTVDFYKQSWGRNGGKS